MIDNKRGLVSFMFLGKVTQDKGEDDWDILVHPMEIVPTYTGDISKENKINTTNEDHLGNQMNVIVNKDRRIRCRWIKMFGGANRVTPPSVCVGEIVTVINLGDSDKFYWTDSIFADSDFRKRENMILYLSNKDKATPNDTLQNGYYLRMDTYKKVIHLHTSNNDQEFTTYDLHLNTKDGVLTFEDGKKNKYTWDTKNNKYIMHTDTQNGEFTTYDKILDTKNGNYLFKDGKNNYFKWDTKNDQYAIHTDKNNGELTTYDIIVDSKSGTVTLKDGKGNFIKLESGSDTLTINTNNDLTINTTNTVNVNTTTATVNATDTLTVNTKTATVNASQSATISTTLCTISSQQCQIN